ncbi:MAG: hydrogenase membrane subunit [Methanomicrobiales archaeon HGW-Methanomicrobiales-4]|nr:MAG: hydrogenase membrane subunit [Methanomicrobiales archaeon HGW-Methanomicrobiales-4]
MIAVFYPVITLVILLLQSVQKKHRAMSLLGVLHSASLLLVTIILMASPGEWKENTSLFMIDHLNLLLMLITGIIFTCASVYAVGYIDGLVRSGELDRRSLRIFYLGFSLLLLVTTMTLLSPNMAQFWIFAELTTIFSALLIAILAVKDTIDASLKYIFVCSTSMLFSFIGVIFFFELVRNATGTGSLEWQILQEEAAGFDAGMLGIASIFLFIGFAAKSGIVPLHTWLPEAHAKAPSAVSAVLSGAILNVGMYGILRMVGIVNQSNIWGQTSLLLLIFEMITMSVACFSMLRQTNTKKLIAFSSIENMGFLLLATGIGTPIAIFWMLFHMMGHSLVKAGLFFSAGILHRQYHSHIQGEEDRISDLFRLQPFAAGAFILGSIAIIGTPLFPIFLSKFGILLEAGKISLYIPLIALVLFAIAAVALFRHLLSVMGTESPAGEAPAPYLAPRWMRAPVIFLLLLSGAIGLFMIPGEEEFLLAAVLDLGITGGVL